MAWLKLFVELLDEGVFLFGQPYHVIVHITAGVTSSSFIICYLLQHPFQLASFSRLIIYCAFTLARHWSAFLL